MNDDELNRRELTGDQALRFAREAGMEDASRQGLFYAGVGDLIRFARLVREGWTPPRPAGVGASGPRCDRCNDSGWHYADPMDPNSMEPCCEPLGAPVMRAALERIAGLTLSQFMGPHDMALECVNVAQAGLAAGVPDGQ